MDADLERIHLWAALAVAEMLETIKRVVVFEYMTRINELER